MNSEAMTPDETIAQLRAEIERYKTPATAIRDCTLDELIEQLGSDHLCARQIAGLRSIIRNRHGIDEQELNVHGSVALMRQIAKLERDLAREKEQFIADQKLIGALKRRREELVAERYNEGQRADAEKARADTLEKELHQAKLLRAEAISSREWEDALNKITALEKELTEAKEKDRDRLADIERLMTERERLQRERNEALGSTTADAVRNAEIQCGLSMLQAESTESRLAVLQAHADGLAKQVDILADRIVKTTTLNIAQRECSDAYERTAAYRAFTAEGHANGYFQGHKADKPHPHMPATGTEGSCELCGEKMDAPLHQQFTAEGQKKP